MKRYRTFTFRLYPTENQLRELGILLETHRRLYNKCLEIHNIAYSNYGLRLMSYDLYEWFKHECQSNPWFARINRSSAQTTMGRFDESLFRFFLRVKAGDIPGYPRFKNEKMFNTIEFKVHGNGIKLSEKIYVQYVGDVRIKQHREIQGKIKTARLRREGEKWYAAFSCEYEAADTVSQNPPIGIDLGLKSFLTTSEGKHESNPRLHKKKLPEMRRANRRFARKTIGGKNQRKSAKELGRIHRHIGRCRRDFHHKTALGLVKCYGLIAVERLRIMNLLKNRRLARSISDAGWGRFIKILKHKAENAGVRVVEVDPAYTSQDCPHCGHRKAKTLWERWHSCGCGLSIHRDTASAQEILNRGLKIAQARIEPVGANAGLTTSALPKKPKRASA